jgi:tRNA pseudouridine55 synthase
MDGIICVYKPIGFTSFDVIAIMRKLLHTKKIGHTGTLDPCAEGVLPIFAGAATKAVDFTPDTGKEYRAAFKIGLTTDTQDITGRILSEASPCYVPQPRIDKAITRFIGEIEQIPPMYSAVKMGGKRLYQLARKGIEVDRNPRKITVESFELEQYDDIRGEGVVKIACSKGTYIRTLIHDLGQELGFGAVMTGLQRTKSNGFSIDECYCLDTLRNLYQEDPDKLFALLSPISILFEHYPKAFLDQKQTGLFNNGATLNADLVRLEKVYDGQYAVFDDGQRLVALGKIERDHTISIIQRFNYANAKQD